jgi:hypothetical protein
MIILEGPDGGGKTTLLKQLTSATGLPAHERASHSTKGPRTDLYEWTTQDMLSWHEQPLAIYDRHPLTSEHIYGPTVRGDVRPGFEMSNRELAYMRRHLRRNALVIICLPPLETVRENVAGEIGQMDGVLENIDHIYECYRMMLHIWPLDSHIARYNYLDGEHGSDGYAGILAAALHHKYSWRGAEYVH